MTTIQLSKENLQKLQEYKIHPRETNNDVLGRLLLGVNSPNNSEPTIRSRTLFKDDFSKKEPVLTNHQGSIKDGVDYDK